MDEAPATDDPAGADLVANRRWAQVREIAGDIARLEAADRTHGLDDGQRMELARLRMAAERASARAVLADELADSIASAQQQRRHRA